MTTNVHVNAMQMTYNRTLHANEDCGNLQDKPNAIYAWPQDWQLGISYKKCNLMYIGHTNCKPSLLLKNVRLAVMDEVKDLGVVTDSCILI